MLRAVLIYLITYVSLFHKVFKSQDVSLKISSEVKKKKFSLKFLKSSYRVETSLHVFSLKIYENFFLLSPFLILFFLQRNDKPFTLRKTYLYFYMKDIIKRVKKYKKMWKSKCQAGHQIFHIFYTCRNIFDEGSYMKTNYIWRYVRTRRHVPHKQKFLCNRLDKSKILDWTNLKKIITKINVFMRIQFCKIPIVLLHLWWPKIKCEMTRLD